MDLLQIWALYWNELNCFFVSWAVSFTELLQVAGGLISANPGFDLIQASLSFLQRIFSDIFPILCSSSNYQNVDKFHTNPGLP